MLGWQLAGEILFCFSISFNFPRLTPSCSSGVLSLQKGQEVSRSRQKNLTVLLALFNMCSAGRPWYNLCIKIFVFIVFKYEVRIPCFLTDPATSNRGQDICHIFKLFIIRKLTKHDLCVEKGLKCGWDVSVQHPHIFPTHFFFTHISENFPAPVRTRIATPANIRTHTNSMCKTLPVIFRPRIWQQ